VKEKKYRKRETNLVVLDSAQNGELLDTVRNGHKLCCGQEEEKKEIVSNTDLWPKMTK